MQNDNTRLKEICSKILELNPKIRYVGVINPYGKTIVGRIKHGIRPLFKSEEAMNEFFLAAIRRMLRKQFENSLGKHILTLTLHEKINIVELSSNAHIIYMSFEKDTNLDEMVEITNKAKMLLEGY